jgi:hypothetical protein
MGVLSRLIREIRARCPKTHILVRADSGFAVPRLMERLEQLARQLRQRLHEHHSDLGQLQLDTLRLRLLKVAAIVTQSARRILVRQPLAHPWVSTHAALAEWLSPAPT